MTNRGQRFTAFIAVVFVLCAVAAVIFLRSDLLVIEQLENTAFNAPPHQEQIELNVVKDRLLAVGLHPTGLLSDLGVDGHMARLAKGEVNNDLLFAYAEAIETLSKRSSERGQKLPPTLWDVSTPALREAGWTVYSLTSALASEGGAIHVNLLSDAYASFLQTRPNALSGALSLIPLANAYVKALPEEARAERAEHAKTNGEATLLIWQALLSGTTRYNPLTHKPLWSHGYVGHFSVPRIHQYATGRGATQNKIWGVRGFGQAFIGTASNDNQVEHLGISSLLQGVVHVPGAVLSAVEGMEVLVNHENPAAAAADRALNQVVRDVMVPSVENDPAEIVDALQKALQ